MFRAFQNGVPVVEHDLQHLREAFKLGRKELRFGFREQALRDFEPEKDS